jgi:hypothetical protein
MSLINKKISQHPPLSGESISLTTRFNIIHNPGTGIDNYTMFWGDKNGDSIKGLLYAISQALNETYIPTTCAANSTRGIAIGDYQYARIEYIAIRGSMKKGGVIEVLYDNPYSRAEESGLDNTDEEEHGGKWLSVDPYINSGSLMSITFRADDSDEVVTNIKYKIITKIGF